MDHILERAEADYEGYYHLEYALYPTQAGDYGIEVTCACEGRPSVINRAENLHESPQGIKQLLHYLADHRVFPESLHGVLADHFYTSYYEQLLADFR